MHFRWGDCELDREARVLSRSGRPVRAQPLVVDLLLLLLENRERVVSDTVLRRKLWPGVQVTDASLRRLIKEARRAIGDDGSKQAQIQTVRGRGFLFAPQVSIEQGWDASFVGRRDVLGTLEQKLEEVANGIGAVTLVRGPAGIGKTRTLQEIAARAETRGFQVLHGGGHVGARGEAFHPWVDAVRELAIEPLAAPSPHDASPGDSSADAQRLVRFRRFATLLARLARETPMLIALDDLQLADRDSIALLRFVTPLLARARVWILAAYRTSAGKASEASLHELTALAAESSTHVVELAGLAADELRVLVRNQIRAEVGAPLAALLADRTLGNPLFAIEVARSLRRDARSLEGEPAPELEAEFARGVEPLVARRLSALSGEAQQLLRAASALGTEFDPELVSAAEDCSSRALARVLDEGEAAGLLLPTSAGRWRFAHPLFAEGLYAALDAESGGAAAQHLRIAEALERSGSSDPFAIARHFSRARPAAKARRVLPYAAAAASAAWRQYAFADAELWYREAIALAEETDAEPGDLSDLYLALAEVVLATIGIISARESFKRAAQLAMQAGDARRLSKAALGYAHRPFAFGADPSVVEWLRAAQTLPTGEPSLEARVSSRLGAELIGLGPAHRSEVGRLLDAGVATARGLGEPLVLCRVLFDLSVAQLSAADTHAWIALAEEIQHHAREAGDLELEFRAIVSTATGYVELGDRRGVETALLACQRFAAVRDSGYMRSVTSGIEAMLALLDGRLADARTAIDHSERQIRPTTSVGISTVIGVQRFMLAVEEGRAAELVPALEAAQARFPAHAALGALAGFANALAGKTDAARRSLATVIQHLPGLAYDRNRLPTLALAAEVAFRVGDAQGAAALEPELAPYAALSAVAGNAALYVGSISHALGWVAAARGRTLDAVEHFRAGLRAHEALRSPTWTMRSTAAIAEVTDGRVTLLRA